ncbi:IS110 family transposase [Tunturiibacter gelidoferens]|uniref:Transposase n=1 Tax=Tunturiibacter gelidiferens TaxID=3069689 RepID=A0AAU7Z0K3_9BACT
MMQETLNKQDRHLTVGLDLGDRSSFYCVLDEAGEVLMEQRLSTTPNAIKEIFGAMPRSRIALETGTHSPWVSRLLSELGHEAIVAHARSVRLIGESRRKDDRIDARTLARLVRIDPQLLCPVKHRSAEAQADLTVIRAAALVRTRTMLVNAARGLTRDLESTSLDLIYVLKLAYSVELCEGPKGPITEWRAAAYKISCQYPTSIHSSNFRPASLK